MTIQTADVLTFESNAYIPRQLPERRYANAGYVDEQRVRERRAIPEVGADIFENAPEAAFWVGPVAVGNNVMLPEGYNAALKLRANVYITEKKFLEESNRQPDGSEYDEDDRRSSHFTVIQNHPKGISLLTGNMRSIARGDKELPVEHYFPESFAKPLTDNAVEASRFISRNPDQVVQSAVASGLIRAVVMDALQNNKEEIYAIVERPLASLFKFMGIPFEKVADQKYLEEYHTENLAIRFSPEEILETAKKDVTQRRRITPYFQTAEENHGVGFYGSDLLSPIQIDKVA